MFIASELNVKWGLKNEMVLIADTLLVLLSYSQSKFPSDGVQGQRPTTMLPSALGILGERDAVVLYWEEE